MQRTRTWTRAALALIATLAVGARAQGIHGGSTATTAAPIPTAPSVDIYSGHYSEQTGEAIYKGICQGCHMPDAKGAVGAGAYPPLAGDRRLQAGAYAAMVVVRGQKAMPSFGDGLSDAQIAEVVNYIRSNFGNRYTDKVTPETVKALRLPPSP